MNRFPTLARLVLAAGLIPTGACATCHGVRWAYGEPSCHFTPDKISERGAIRAVAGLPVIVGSVAFDVVTWPFQLMFGVWPMWGDRSTQMQPPMDDVKPAAPVPAPQQVARS